MLIVQSNLSDFQSMIAKYGRGFLCISSDIVFSSLERMHMYDLYFPIAVETHTYVHSNTAQFCTDAHDSTCSNDIFEFQARPPNCELRIYNVKFWN